MSGGALGHKGTGGCRVTRHQKGTLHPDFWAWQQFKKVLRRMDSMDSNSLILKMENISKAFPGVQALDDVSFQCKRGEVHALVGENGAGKSTLMKILAGAYKPDRGAIIFKDREVEIRDPRHAQELGISIMYQEFNLIPYLDVAQNIFLGREPLTRFGTVDYPKMYAEAAKLLSRLGVDLDLREWVMGLTIAEQQMVEIAKALSLDAELIIMDEPSSALSGEETERLFEIVRSLRSQEITVIYISHRIREIFEVADRVTVLKDGLVVGTEDVRNVDENSLIRMMIGRTLDVIFPEKGRGDREPVLSVVGLSRQGAFEDISFDLYRGEILGVAGLLGSGRTALARAIFGADPADEGEMYLNGHKIKMDTPKSAVRVGVGLVPEDRIGDGLVLCLSVGKNITLPVLGRIRRLLFTQARKEKQIASGLVSDLDIRTPSIEQEVQYLSGGNQQKVILAKWLAVTPQVIVFDEPTRGIDVGAKAEIHHLMRQLANKGSGILMISSELPEILGMSDRILVMCEGRITTVFSAEEATEEKIMAAATGVCVAEKVADREDR